MTDCVCLEVACASAPQRRPEQQVGAPGRWKRDRRMARVRRAQEVPPSGEVRTLPEAHTGEHPAAVGLAAQ